MGGSKDIRAGFLFATPGFLSGMARLFDLFGGFDSYNESRTAEEADSRALAADWHFVGQDLGAAFDQFEKEQAPLQRELFERA